MTRKTFFQYFFFIASSAELIALAVDWSNLQLFAKPLIMLSLLGYYLATAAIKSNTFIKAIFFSWAGDVLLMFSREDETFFIAGLLAFLISHLLYISTYRQHQQPDTRKGLLGTQKVRYSLPIILAGTGLIVILFPSLGNLKLPVMVYAIVLMVMVITAMLRYGRTASESFWYVFAGAILFMTSDSMLAINKFLQPFPGASLGIMATYITGQYLIVEGILKHH